MINTMGDQMAAGSYNRTVTQATLTRRNREVLRYAAQDPEWGALAAPGSGAGGAKYRMILDLVDAGFLHPGRPHLITEAGTAALAWWSANKG